MNEDRYAMYAPMHADDGTVMLTCRDCGAVVQARSAEIHNHWHETQLRRGKQK